jgi:hypothetical protein
VDQNKQKLRFLYGRWTEFLCRLDFRICADLYLYLQYGLVFVFAADLYLYLQRGPCLPGGPAGLQAGQDPPGREQPAEAPAAADGRRARQHHAVAGLQIRTHKSDLIDRQIGFD